MKNTVSLLVLVSMLACGESPDVAPGVLASALSASGADIDAGNDVEVSWPALRFADIGPVTVVSQSFMFSEGPVWDPQQQVLYFSDINGRAIYRLTLPGQIELVTKLSFDPDGLALGADGQLLLAGYASRSVQGLVNARVQPIVASFEGKSLNSPDDLTTRADGTVYFTDPTFGLTAAPRTGAQLGFQGIYRISPDGSLSLEDQSKSEGPNGISLSPDERTLYVSYTTSGKVARYDVHADGSLGPRAAFASGLTIADSMCVDSAGNLYVATSSGIAVLDTNGKRLGTIPTKSQVPSNCAFGGPDQRTLFITARRNSLGTPTATSASIMSIANMPIPGMPGRN